MGEALVLWAGRPEGAGVVVSHLLLPRCTSGRDYLTVPRDERIAVATFLRREQLLVFADVHTHPRAAYLSPTDRTRPFSTMDGFYAIVLPDFANGPAGIGLARVRANRPRLAGGESRCPLPALARLTEPFGCSPA